MLHFLQNFVYYVAVEVISPQQHELRLHMDEVKDMDEMLDLHENFLDSCLKECLLDSQDLLKILTKIMTTCLLFADQMRRYTLLDTMPGLNTAQVSVNSVEYEKERLEQRISMRNNKRLSIAESPTSEASVDTRKKNSIGGGPRFASKQTAASTKKNDAHLDLLHMQRAQRLKEHSEYIRTETTHDSFKRILAKFTDAFDTQVSEP
jgi:hypothetical protein